jgi:hypothetical protein
MLKQGSSDPTSPRREASLFDLPGSSEPGLFFQGLSFRSSARREAREGKITPGVPPGSQPTALASAPANTPWTASHRCEHLGG